MKILTIVGARPQFIKSAVISKLLAKNKNIKEIIIHTGQHYDNNMSEIFFTELGISEPDYNLNVGSGSHAEQTAKMLTGIAEVINKIKPDYILIYGDTNSTIAAALSAIKMDIPIVHVEAGLRSFNKNMPEEINRILTDHMSTILFTPSKTGVENLFNEGFKNIFNNGKPANKIINQIGKFGNIDKNSPIVFNVGDIMFDAVLNSIRIAEKKSKILETLNVESGHFSLLTIHRAENTDSSKKFKELINFVNEISNHKKVIFPIHPRTKKLYLNSGGPRFADNIKIIEPLGYFDILLLLKNSQLLMTDSGGMQKEAYWLGTPCITLRDQTEWVETIENKRNILYRDFQNFDYFRKDYDKYVYGNGQTGKLIIKILNML
jgi:UDP-GlcNAc3NAcA epimerase